MVLNTFANVRCMGVGYGLTRHVVDNWLLVIYVIMSYLCLLQYTICSMFRLYTISSNDVIFDIFKALVTS